MGDKPIPLNRKAQRHPPADVEVTVCSACGCAVADTEQHDKWHEKLSAFVLSTLAAYGHLEPGTEDVVLNAPPTDDLPVL